MAACFRFGRRRVVQNDSTLRYESRWFQLAAMHQKLALAGRSVTVCQRLDGRLELLYGGRALSYRELPAPPKRQEAAGSAGDRSQSGATAGCGPSVEAAVAWGESAGGRGAGVAPARLARLRDAGPTLSGSVSYLSPRGHFYL